MSWFTYFIIGGIIIAVAGYYYGQHLLKKAEKISKKTLIESSTDSIAQAKLFASAIGERAGILGSSDLSWKFNDDKKSYTFYAMDEIITDYGIHTQSFLAGTSIRFIKFIRLCHSCGCSIMLRQIGEKVDILENAEQEYYLSKPELDMFI